MVILPPFFDNTSQDMQTAARAALVAGGVIKKGYQQVHQIDSKEVGDLVSRVDFDADAAATDVLKDASSLPILSEELSPETDDVNQKMWVVDPLDGSTAYLMAASPRLPSVLIAICDHGLPVLGLTYFPLTGEWFYAQRELGAWKNGQRLTVNSRDVVLKECWVEVNQYGNAELETKFVESLKKNLRSPIGSRIMTSNFPHAGVAMRVAEDPNGIRAAVHDNNPASVKQGPWDIAANQIIFEEAGGVFLNPSLKQTSPFKAEPIVIAATTELAKQIVDLASAKTQKPIPLTSATTTIENQSAHMSSGETLS